MRDGQRVSYIGHEVEGLAMGDRGEVLSAADTASHVLFQTGSRKGAVLLVDHLDLTTVQTSQKVATIDDGLDDSLDVGTLSLTATREIYENEGEAGVINTMAEAGHLGAFAAIAQEAHDLITTRIRNDPSFRVVTSQLEDEEAESVIRMAAAVLLRDAFGVEE